MVKASPFLNPIDHCNVFLENMIKWKNIPLSFHRSFDYISAKMFCFDEWFAGANWSSTKISVLLLWQNVPSSKGQGTHHCLLICIKENKLKFTWNSFEVLRIRNVENGKFYLFVNATKIINFKECSFRPHRFICSI